MASRFFRGFVLRVPRDGEHTCYGDDVNTALLDVLKALEFSGILEVHSADLFLGDTVDSLVYGVLVSCTVRTGAALPLWFAASFEREFAQALRSREVEIEEYLGRPQAEFTDRLLASGSVVLEHGCPVSCSEHDSLLVSLARDRISKGWSG